MNTFFSIIRSSYFLLFLGGICYYLALPPVGFAPFALAVPICWIFVIKRQETVKLRWVYFAAVLFWLASIWWIACPHPFTSLGLLALSAYLSIYWVLFFVAARTAVHRFRVPIMLAMPLCWIGCEYLRCRIFGGFSFCALEHALYRSPALIQWAYFGGSFFVGGIIMLTGGIFGEKQRSRKIAALGLICFFIFLPLFVAIDRDYDDNSSSSGMEVAVLQGNSQVHLDDTPKDAEKNFRQFLDLTYQLVNERKQKGKNLPGLIVFPETVCPIPILSFEGSIKAADVGLTNEDAADGQMWLQHFVNQIDVPVIIGVSVFRFKDHPEPVRLNSALFLRPQREEQVLPAALRYDKVHLVMFGEYIPFSEYLPDNFILKTLCQEAGRGNEPIAMPIGQCQNGKPIEASVNICFESSVSHLIRKQMLTLRKRRHDPRVLINISNDGWFRFSQQIDQHLATQVFRAVEHRMWYITATNGGFSAIISPHGEIVNIGKRGDAEAVVGIIYAGLNKEQRATLYQRFGDWYALVCALGVIGLAILARGNKKQ